MTGLPHKDTMRNEDIMNLESIARIPEIVAGVSDSARISAIALLILIIYVAFRLYRERKITPDEG